MKNCQKSPRLLTLSLMLETEYLLSVVCAAGGQHELPYRQVDIHRCEAAE